MGRTRCGNSVLSKQDSKTTDLSLTWVFLLQHALNVPLYIDNGDFTLFLWGFFFAFFAWQGCFFRFPFSLKICTGNWREVCMRNVWPLWLMFTSHRYSRFSAVISIEANSASNTTIKCNFNKVHYLFIYSTVNWCVIM